MLIVVYSTRLGGVNDVDRIDACAHQWHTTGVCEYRLYIDESGDHTYHRLNDLSRRYLGLTGVIIERRAYDLIFQPYLEGLKVFYFHQDTDRPVILHRDDIRSFDGSFKVLLDTEVRETWENSILNYFANLRNHAQIFTVVIDKKQHKAKYPNETFDPYHYSLEVLLWRVRGYLVPSRPVAKQADIISESRNPNLDFRLKEVYRELRTTGPTNKQFGTPEGYKEAYPASELYVQKKIANVAGLQIADLVATGQKLETLERENKPLPSKITRFTRKLNGTIDPMINRWGRYLVK